MAMKNPAYQAIQRALVTTGMASSLLLSHGGWMGCALIPCDSTEITRTQAAYKEGVMSSCGDNEQCVEDMLKDWDECAAGNDCFPACRNTLNFENNGYDYVVECSLSAGVLRLTAQPDCSAGRPPCNYVATPETNNRGVAAWLANAALLEAASVPAFEQLRQLLARHDCPDDLLKRIDIAAADERRHAALMRSHAMDFGATSIGTFTFSAPTPHQVAIENFVHGCLGESLAAALAAVQAQAATAALRATMTTIAREEASHAALSCDLDTWLGSVGLGLTTQQKRQLATAWADSPGEALDGDTRAVLGLPAAAVVRVMRRAIAASMVAGVS